MNIYILDGLNGIAGVIDTFRSAIWNIQYYGQGDFQLVVVGTPQNIALLHEGVTLCREKDIYPASGVHKNVMIVENVALHYDTDEGYLLTVSGRSIKSYLSRRIIWNQTNYDGNLELLERQIITDNVISPSVSARAIAHFALTATIHSYPATIKTQLFGENIAEWLETIGETYGYGWDVYIYNGNYTFSTRNGIDRSTNQSDVMPVIFSPSNNNLLSCDYSKEKGEYKNAALVGGEGEGTSKRTATVGTASGLSRYEVYVDGSDVSSNGEIITAATYTALLQQYGREQLAQTEHTETFDAEIATGGLYKLGVDYNIGDIVTIKTERGITEHSRLIEIIESEDENGTAAVGTFKEWEVE